MLGTRNLYLVGLMGAGKTTVGKALAKRLGKSFLDSDLEIERRTGVKVQLIFEIEGESGFRTREAQTIAELTAMRDVVLATGGGAVMNESNRACLRANGFVIYLRAHPRDLWLRTRHDRSRPLLQTPDPVAKLQELYQARDPHYREVADLIVDTGRQRVGHLVAHVLAQLPEECKLSA